MHAAMRSLTNTGIRMPTQQYKYKHMALNIRHNALYLIYTLALITYYINVRVCREATEEGVRKLETNAKACNHLVHRLSETVSINSSGDMMKKIAS